MRRILILLLAIFSAAPAGAQSSEVLPDPTRPPESLIAATASGGEGVVVSGPVLQSVVLRRGASVAVISGQTVPLGGKVGESVLVKIAENEVVLRGSLGTEVLRMTPEVDKTVVAERPRSGGRRK